MSIARHIAVVGTAALASRVLGFVRDVVIAGLFGAGPRADAFVVAFQFTNLIRRLLTEGALNAAFVPLYLRQRDGGEAHAAVFAGRVIGTLTLALLALALLLAFAMPFVMLALAPGFDMGPLKLAIELARLMLPYLVLAGPVAVLMGVLNANNHFSTAALAAVIFNVVILIALAFVFLRRTGDSDLSAHIVAVAIALAGVCQLALVGVTVWIGPEKATPLGLLSRRETRRFASLAIPGLIASGIPQLTMIGAVMVASDWPSAAAWLYYANRLVELPLGIVGIAIGTVMTPALSHALRGGDEEIGPRTIRHAIEMSLGLALPAAIALALLAWPIVRILFERGAFTMTDSAATAAMLAAFALGLPGHVLVKALSAVFFSREDTRTPMLVAVFGLGAAIVGGIGFMLAEWPTGIALAVAASGWIGAALLWWLAVRRGLMAAHVVLWRRLLLIGLSALAMGAVVHAGAASLGLAMPGPIARLTHGAALGAVIVLGLVFYLCCLWLLRIVRPADLRKTAHRA